MVRLELATPGLQPNALAIELYSSISYCWEGVEFEVIMMQYTNWINSTSSLTIGIKFLIV